MARFTPAEWTEFQAVRALCYRGLDSAALRAAVGERVARWLRADAFAFLSLDPASGLPVHAVHNWPLAMCDAANERAVLVSPAAEFGRLAVGSRRAYLVEQLTSPEAGADPYLAEVLRPFGFDHEVQVGFAAGGRAWGNLRLNRRAGRESFGWRDLQWLEALVPHVTAGLRTALARAALAAAPGSGVGVVLLGPDGRIELANGVAERLLHRPAQPGRLSHWMAVQVVASCLTRAIEEEGADLIPALTIVDDEQGEAYRLRAERARGTDGILRGLVLIEPDRRTAHAEALLTLGLTAREAEVVLAVLRGQSTAQIAAALAVSSYTVQDHVRHACAKLGVGSRRELAAVLLGTTAPADAVHQALPAAIGIPSAHV